MPKLKQPCTLQDIVLESLGMYIFRVIQKAITVIGSGRTPEINVYCLNRLLHGDLPHVLSQKVTVHVFSIVTRILKSLTIPEIKLNDYGDTNVRNVVKSVILASICPCVSTMNMSKLPPYAQKILIDNLSTFNKLHTLSVTAILADDVIKLLPTCLTCCKYLVNFRLQLSCTDDIINTLGLCCSETMEQIDVTNSKNVTNASFQFLIKCHKLNHILISGTSMTSEVFVQFLQTMEQHRNSDNTKEGFLHVSVGTLCKWIISSRELSEIAITCPMLKQLEINYVLGDLGKLGNLTELEVLKIGFCEYDACNFEGFLRLKGKNLTSLKLRIVYPPVDLINIMNHCINLRELILDECSIMDIDLGHIENDGKALEKLEILVLDGLFSLHSIEHILYKGINIKELSIYPEGWEEDITDEFILRLLSKNPLQKLTKFSADSPYLSMKSVNAIIEQCPVLETLGELDEWKGITDTEIKILRKEIKDKNQDLRINLLKEIAI